MTDSKYGNVRVEEDGYTFDSKAELSRYRELKMLESIGEVSTIEVHPKWTLFVNGVRVCAYVADFSYHDHESGERIVEDVKGVKTPAYNMKRRLMKAIYDIDIHEVPA